MKKRIIVIIIITLILIGLASYFYSFKENRENMQKVYREMLDLNIFVDYRERHLYLYANRFLFKECDNLNNTECREYLSTYGWKLYGTNGNIVRFNITVLDEILNSMVDVYKTLIHGFKVMIYDFGYYTRILFYKTEVLSKRGLDPLYFPEPYQLKEQILNAKLDFDMKALLETPVVIGVIYYDVLITAVKGWIAGVWLLFYFVVDETIIQLIVASFLANFLMVLTREFVFLGVNKLSGGTIKYWMFQKYASLLQEIGLLDVFNNGMAVLIMVRVFFIAIGLPYLFNFGALYGVMLVFIYCFWYIISHMQHKIKYEVELKIKADVGLKKATKVEFSFYTFMERVGIWFLKSFWTLTPLPLRVYRQGFDFRPFKDLVAPSNKVFYISIISLCILVPLTFIVDIIFHTIAWTICYLWLYPYVFNRRISETKWLEISKSIEDRSVIINSEILEERDDYLHNLIRSWLLIFGFYRLNGEIIRTKSKFSEFIEDIKQAKPDNNMLVWAKVYEMPSRYLKGKFLHLDPKNKEKYELFLNGLEMDAYRLYGEKDIRLIWTKGSKEGNALNSVKSVIDSLFLKKFGKRWTPSFPLQEYVHEDKEVPPGFDEENNSRYKGLYFGVNLDFEAVSPEEGFARFVTKYYDGNKMANLALDNVQRGTVPELKDMRMYDAMFTLSYLRYSAMYFYSEDIVTVPTIKHISDLYYIDGVNDIDYCKTVCLSACVLADLNILVEIKQSLITRNIVKTRDLKANHFIKDAYERLSLAFNEEYIMIDEEEGKIDIPSYKHVYLPEYKDFTEQSNKDLAVKFSKITEVKGSILTQLGHLQKQVHNKDLNKLYKMYREKLVDLEKFMIYPVYLTGAIQSDVAISDSFMMRILNSLEVDSEISNEFKLWLSNFKSEQWPLVLAWFVQNNKTFMYRYIPKEELNHFILKGGLDKHKAWFQPDSNFELKKKEFFNFVDKIRGIAEPLIVGSERKDDDYIELEDFKDPMMDLGYSNMSRLSYTVYEKEVYKGLKTIGIQREYAIGDIFMHINKDMVKMVRTFSPQSNLAEYVIANPNKDLVFQAIDKYKRRKFLFDLNQTYQGINFYEWLFSMLDNLYNVEEGFKAVVREIDSFSIEDLSLQSRKASPGFLTNRNGVRNKADKLELTKAWAKTYRKSILVEQPLDHIWMMLVVPKTCKPGAEEVRVVNAPEMYFYINQFLIYETFVKLSRFSKVTNDFCLFFGDFDKAVRKHTAGYEIESLDLRSQGGRIQREIKDIFVKWYGRFMPTAADKVMLKYLTEDIFSCKFMIPANYGGFIFEKKDGWCDGPYGTNQFDSWTMVVYYLMNVWNNVVGLGGDISDIRPEKFVIESHGDNWIHSYPPNKSKLFAWRPSFLEDIGQEVKGTISRSLSPIGLELMGFVISLRDGLYVGTRPTAKTIKSLVFNKKQYKVKEIQKSYEKSIISCLRLVDCWNTEAFELLNKLEAIYASVEPKAVTVDDEYKLYILEESDNQPRRAWTYESKRIRELSEADPTNLSLWIEKD